MKVVNIRMMALPAIVPLVLGLAACGGSDTGTGVASAKQGSSKSTPSPSGSLDPEDAMLKFTQCMRQHGVKMKDPVKGQRSTFTVDKGSGSVLEKASKACQKYMQGGTLTDEANDPKVQDAMVKFNQCMRQNGVNVPDPKPGGGSLIPKGTPRAKVEAATKACEKYRPGNLVGGSGPVNGQSGAAGQ
jgi:hypothetical protein